MEEKLKLKNVHTVLFFRNTIEYNSLQVANKILSKLPQLGQPNIFNLPKEIPNEIRKQAPTIIFNNNKEVSLNMTIVSLELNVSTIESMNESRDLVLLLYDVLLEEGIQIQSIGIVHDYVCFDFNFEKIKTIFYKDEILQSDLVNCSWYKKEDGLNIWKVINVEEKNYKKVLNARIDINNKGNQTEMNKEDLNSALQLSYERAVKFKDELSRKIGE